MSGVASKIAQERAKAAGLGSVTNPIKFADQDFETLRTECLASGKLFEDPKFPAAQSSLGIKKIGPDSDTVKGLVWKRPSEINKNPQFIVDGANREDIRQGGIGNCWFLSSIACLTLNEDCLTRVVPLDQSFDKNYAGIFHFMFWQYGQWMDVVVDDRLPAKGTKLKFGKSKSSDEFWSPLVEKAYAKLYGSYEALISGYAGEALEDLTAGVGLTYNTTTAPADLFQIVQRALLEKSMVTCASNKSDETISSSNIVASHLYSVTRVEEVACDEKTVQLIRLRNPWGYKEWNGAWSDDSTEWNNVDPKVAAELNIKEDDGEVWMCFPDYLKEYTRLNICNINLSEVCCGDNFQWCLAEFNGSWKKGSSSGGRVHLDTFWINPQYRITVDAPDGDTSKTHPIYVSVTQKERRKKKPEGTKNLHIGFYIFKVNSSDTIPLGKTFFKNNKHVASLDAFHAYREAADRFELLPGDYVIVPATVDVDLEADFYLRVFTKKPSRAQETESIVQAYLYEPVLTPETDAEFDTVKDELEKGEFNEDEVKNLLNKMLVKYPDIKGAGFSAEAVRQLIKLMDTDNTGTLSTEEFKKTWLKVVNYKNLFTSADADRTGTISVPEFRDALQKAGFTLKISNIDTIAERFMNGDQLTFVEFVKSAARLETLLKMFTTLDPSQNGSINLSVSEWLSAGMV